MAASFSYRVAVNGGPIPTLASKPKQLELKGFGNFHR
jgi:hypothetical protein